MLYGVSPLDFLALGIAPIQARAMIHLRLFMR
jgi:hypothetical protein